MSKLLKIVGEVEFYIHLSRRSEICAAEPASHLKRNSLMAIQLAQKLTYSTQCVCHYTVIYYIYFSVGTNASEAPKYYRIFPLAKLYFLLCRQTGREMHTVIDSQESQQTTDRRLTNRYCNVAFIKYKITNRMTPRIDFCFSGLWQMQTAEGKRLCH